jgi:predicted nucleic acid-binding protein
VGEIENRPGVICDAGPLIHLDEVDALDLLSDFPAVYVPETVWQEVVAHRPQALSRPEIRLSRVQVELPDDPVFWTLVRTFSLDRGEQEAIQLAAEKQGDILLCDDAAARLVAERLGIRVHGTMGILIRAARRNQRKPAEVIQLLQELPRLSTLHIKPDFLDEIIRDVRDAYAGQLNR